MAAKPIKIVFELDHDDIEYFRKLFQKAQRNASKLDPAKVLADGKKLVKKIRASKRVPPFVLQAIEPRFVEPPLSGCKQRQVVELGLQ